MNEARKLRKSLKGANMYLNCCINCSAELKTHGARSSNSSNGAEVTKNENDGKNSAYYALNCSSRVKSPLEPVTVQSIPVPDALATIFNFNFSPGQDSKVDGSKENAKVNHLDLDIGLDVDADADADVDVENDLDDHSEEFKHCPKSPAICFVCYLVLSDLYRVYVEFSQLRKENSFLGSKLKGKEKDKEKFRFQSPYFTSSSPCLPNNQRVHYQHNITQENQNPSDEDGVPSPLKVEVCLESDEESCGTNENAAVITKFEYVQEGATNPSQAQSTNDIVIKESECGEYREEQVQVEDQDADAEIDVDEDQDHYQGDSWMTLLYGHEDPVDIDVPSSNEAEVQSFEHGTRKRSSRLAKIACQRKSQHDCNLHKDQSPQKKTTPRKKRKRQEFESGTGTESRSNFRESLGSLALLRGHFLNQSSESGPGPEQVSDANRDLDADPNSNSNPDPESFALSGSLCPCGGSHAPFNCQGTHCDHCNKDYINKFVLRKHIRSVLKVDVFRCEVPHCLYECYRKSDFQKHVRTQKHLQAHELLFSTSS